MALTEMTAIITIIISSSSVARCVEPLCRTFWFTRSTSFKHLHQTLKKRKKNRLQRFILIMVAWIWCAQCEDWRTFKSTTTVRMCSSRSWTTTVQVRKTINNFQEIIRLVFLLRLTGQTHIVVPEPRLSCFMALLTRTLRRFSKS